MKKKQSPFRRLALVLSIIAAVVIYAYGFQVTQVSLEETSDPLRQERFIRILRALGRPDLFTYEKEEFTVETPIQVPCRAADGDDAPAPAAAAGKSYLVVTPACADPSAQVTVEG